MYKQILVPLDGSTFAEAALPLALALSEKTRAGIHLASVMEPISAFAYEEGWEASAREWSRDYLESVAERIRGAAGGGVTTGLHEGRVAETLLTEAGDTHADLMIMATHGRGALSRAWLGSVADAIVRQVTVPVLFVRPNEDEASATAPADVGTILVPLDGSDISEQALEHATELGELFDSAYHLIRVVAYPLDITSPYLPHTLQMNQNFVAEAKASAAEYLQENAARMRGRGLRVTTSVVVDAQPGHGVLAEADALSCDLIAMATHGRTRLGRLVLGSTADKVLRGTHVPLLLYRPAKVPSVKV